MTNIAKEIACTLHRSPLIHRKALPLVKVRAVSGQCLTHRGSPSHRSHLWISRESGSFRGAAAGHAIVQRPQSVQKSLLMRTMPSLPFSIARVGQAGMQRGWRQCWQRMARFLPDRSSARTCTLADKGATLFVFLAEQIISQVPQPVHFWGSKRMKGWRGGMK